MNIKKLPHSRLCWEKRLASAAAHDCSQGELDAGTEMCCLNQDRPVCGKSSLFGVLARDDMAQKLGVSSIRRPYRHWQRRQGTEAEMKVGVTLSSSRWKRVPRLPLCVTRVIVVVELGQETGGLTGSVEGGTKEAHPGRVSKAKNVALAGR